MKEIGYSQKRMYLGRTTGSLLGTLVAVWMVSVSSLLSAASLPSFIDEGIHASYRAEVAAVLNEAETAIVLLDNGLDAGFDVGMTASVYSGGESIARIVLVAVQAYCSAALILERDSARAIAAGDWVRLNTVRNS